MSGKTPITPARDGTRRMRWAVVGYFLAIFLPLALLVGGIMAVINYLEHRSGIALLESSERQGVVLDQNRLLSDLAAAISDAVYLSRQSNLLRMLTTGGAPDEVRHDLLCFAETRRTYDAVHCYDVSGREILRVAFHRGQGSASASAATAEPSGGDDAEWSVLAPGEVYLSPLELACRDGAPVLPFKPIIRVGAPVYDAEGVRRGAVLLDYLGTVMLQKMRPENTLLLDPSGQLLHGGRSEERWGNVTGSGCTFAKRYAEAWEKISRGESGQFRTANGLFTFVTVRPLSDARRILPTGVVSAGAARGAGADGYYWKLVAHVPAERLSLGSRRLRAGLVWFYAVLVTMIALVSLPYARLMARRREMQEKLREYATTDALTHVYNRGYGLTLLERLIQECKRLGRKLSIFMIDVNNLKQINDAQGHKAGDAAIRRVAIALRDGLRVVDVVSRFGGDEFLVVLPFTPLEQATGAIERVRKALGREEADTCAGRASFSYGGAEYDPAEDTPVSRLLELADARMYEHKRSAGAERSARRGDAERMAAVEERSAPRPD